MYSLPVPGFGREAVARSVLVRLRPLPVCALGLYVLVASGLPLGWHLVSAHGEPSCHETTTCVSGCDKTPKNSHPDESTVPAHDGHRCEVCYQIAVAKTAVDLPVDDGWATLDNTCDTVTPANTRLLCGQRVASADPRAPPC